MFDYLLQRNIRSDAKALERKQRCFKNFNAIQKVLILFDSQDIFSILPIVDDLKQNGKRVILWTTVDKSSENLPNYVRAIDLTKDLNWTRLFKQPIITEFESLEYDTFLDLSLADNKYLLALKVKNTSNFAIGFRENEYKIYDFILLKEEDKSLFETYEQAKMYLINNA